MQIERGRSRPAGNGKLGATERFYACECVAFLSPGLPSPPVPRQISRASPSAAAATVSQGRFAAVAAAAAAASEMPYTYGVSRIAKQ